MSTCEVTIKNGGQVDWEVIGHVARHIREPERRDFLRHFESVEEGLAHGVQQSRRVGYALLDGRPVAVFGLARSEARGVLHPWLALTKETAEHPYLVMKYARKWFDHHKKAAPRLYNLVPCEDDAAVRFLEVLGFTVDFDNVHEVEGGDYYFFSYEEALN